MFLRTRWWGLEGLLHPRGPPRPCQVCYLFPLTLPNPEEGFPGDSDGKEYTHNAGDPEFDPWAGKIPWGRKWLPTPVFLPGESHGQRSLAGYSPWGRKELDTTEGLTISVSVPRGLGRTRKEMQSGIKRLIITPGVNSALGALGFTQE